MPELPEVETIVQGLKPHLQDATIKQVTIRTPQLRWPIPALNGLLKHQTIRQITRRGKYLLFELPQGTLLIHLGMSGRLCLLPHETPPQRHDHVDLLLTDGRVVRYTDPRRFGAILWTNACPLQHPLLKDLGVEPLTEAFTEAYLLQQTAKRRRAIKPLIMDSKIVVGIGNIYAAESLFLAGIHPAMPAGLLTKTQAARLVPAIKQILERAIAQGGTTLKDFVNGDGRPGYFAQQLEVYGRAGLPCNVCGEPLKSHVLGQRSTVFCEQCQKMHKEP